MKITNRFIESKEELYNYVSDYDIFKYYFDDVKDDVWYPSPFRYESKPSFRISYYKNTYVWTDFGKSVYPQSAIDFVKEYEGLSFYDAINFIYNNIAKQSTKNIELKKEEKPKIKIIYNEKYHENQLDYFRQAKITKKELINYNIYNPLVWINGILKFVNTSKQISVIYMFNEIEKIWKIYNPNSTYLKFYSNNITNHIQGFDRLTYNTDLLIITKSYKDIIIWNKLGYEAIAPHSESIILNNNIIENLKTKYNKIYVNYDNDETGVNKSIQFTNKYNLEHFNTPKGEPKDVFDYVVKYDYKKLDNLFKTKLNES